MNDLRKAADMAIPLLVAYQDYTGDSRIANKCGKAIDALRQALAHPEQEPDYFGLTNDGTWLSVTKDYYKKLKPDMRMAAYREPPAPEPQPIARVAGYYGGRCVIEPLDRKSIFPVGMAMYVSGGSADAIDWEGVAADHAMTIAMMQVDAEQDKKDAARFRWLEQNVYQGVSRLSQVLWCIRGLFGKDGESFREAIDAAMGQKL